MTVDPRPVQDKAKCNIDGRASGYVSPLAM